MYSAHDTSINSRFSVAIVGGGFSGATLAAHLLQLAGPSLSIVLIERAPFRARGIAYATQESRHLLNVPASNMSAFADDPQHFLSWARSNFDSGVQNGDFLSRRLYGQYVESVLDTAISRRRGEFQWRHGEVVGLRTQTGTTELVLRNGDKILADAVVLALGNFPPADLRLPGKAAHSERYLSDPWSPVAPEKTPVDGEVLLVGSGLTSVDTLLTLRARGFRGRIHMLSRHGLLPQSHLPDSGYSTFKNFASSGTAIGLLRVVRAQVREAELRGEGWRSAVDSLRTATQGIWQTLPRIEQERFLRHLRAYWEVHRHRVAPEIGKVLKHQLLGGQLRVHAGRIVEYRENTNNVLVTFNERHRGTRRQMTVDLVVNCTGPVSDIRKANTRMLGDCLRQGLVRPDALSLGIDSAHDGAVINANGIASECLYTVGPLRKGNLWETIAVPEIRAQVADLASMLVNKHRSRQNFTTLMTETVRYV